MDSFKKHIPSFASLLLKVDAELISENVYAQKYLNDLLLHKFFYLHLYALILDRAFENSDKMPAETCILDFGCGNGLLALFAKYCGVKMVYASDVSEPFLLAAKNLSLQLDIKIDGWIAGDENVLITHFEVGQLDILLGSDVIEHVYNLDNLFSVIKQLNSHILTVFTTASVAENPFKSRRLKKLMLKDELLDSNEEQSAASNKFAGLPFLTIRKKMIAHKYTSLQQEQIDKLAILTRGLMEKDIYNAVDEYLRHQLLPVLLQHPTNTCDPITGSWTERLLSQNEYRHLYNRFQFSLKIHHGFYNEFEGGIKSLLASVVNKAILVLGENTAVISPLMILVGKGR